MLCTKKVVLASSSPRRRELLQNAGIEFAVLVANVEEKRKQNETPQNYVIRNAYEKATAAIPLCGENLTDAVILGADTIVVSNKSEILEKPSDNSHAARMLRMLSNNSHIVYTGFVVIDKKTGSILDKQVIGTEVFFREISENLVQAYVSTGEPFDKAGGYGIQGYGSVFVQSINGSYSNVVGLPVCEVVQSLIKHAGISVFLEKR